MATWYEVHWARANACDRMVAMRPAPVRRHATREAAEAEARELRDPRPDVVPVVVQCRHLDEIMGAA